MIYVHRDWSKVPQSVRDALQIAAEKLDRLTDEKDRKKFIADPKNQKKWTALRKYFLKMSFGKCWYSEARDSVGRLQVDHFRPHGQAKQADRDFAESGYSWLAFELNNFRLAGQLCNTVNEEYSKKSVGKGAWFPLVDPNKRATLKRRILRSEFPILLDPTIEDDISKIIFNDDGRVVPNPKFSLVITARITVAIKCLGLSQSALDRDRTDVWKQCSSRIQRFNKLVACIPRGLTALESEIMEETIEELVEMSKAKRPFTAVTRCCLIANGLAYMIVRDELPCLTA
jgi:hypothetical protein